MKARLHCPAVRVTRTPGAHPVVVQAGSVRLHLTAAEAIDLADALVDATEHTTTTEEKR